MSNHSIRKKTRKSLFANSKGFSSIVGAIFAVLIMFSLISTVFVWSLSENSLYNNAVAQNRQLDLDRSNEKVIANITCKSVDPNTAAISGTLENSGPLAVQILTAWAGDYNTHTYAYNDSLNLVLKPGTLTTLSGTSRILVPLPNSDGDNLGWWFISARGNTISEKSFSPTYITNNNDYGNETAQGNATWALLAQGIGAFAFDFTSFKYYNVTQGSPNKLENSSGSNSSGAASYSLPNTKYVAFSFNLTNLYPNGMDITLDRSSCMWSYFPACPGHTLGPVWTIANVNKTTRVINPTYSNITLAYNVTTEVFFAQLTSVVGFDNQQFGLAAVNLLMYGVFGTGSTKLQYAQNIPFVAVNVH